MYVTIIDILDEWGRQLGHVASGHLDLDAENREVEYGLANLWGDLCYESSSEATNAGDRDKSSHCRDREV